MKKVGIAMTIVALTGAGIAAYAFTNKNTKQKADRLINTMLDEADRKLKEM